MKKLFANTAIQNFVNKNQKKCPIKGTFKLYIEE